MKLLDARFRAHGARYVFQCALAAGAVLIVLLVLDAISHTVIIAALGASAFIAFAMPNSRTSAPRFLIGGYLVGTLVGCLCHIVAALSLFAQVPFVRDHAYEIFGALSVGLAIFVMVVTDTEHPPAAGLALGFVLNQWDIVTVIVVVVGIAVLVLVKTLLKPVLIDLV